MTLLVQLLMSTCVPYLKLPSVVVECKLHHLTDVFEVDHGDKLTLADLDEPSHEKLIRCDKDICDQLQIFGVVDGRSFVAVQVFQDHVKHLCGDR